MLPPIDLDTLLNKKLAYLVKKGYDVSSIPLERENKKAFSFYSNLSSADKIVVLINNNFEFFRSSWRGKFLVFLIPIALMN